MRQEAFCGTPWDACVREAVRCAFQASFQIKPVPFAGIEGESQSRDRASSCFDSVCPSLEHAQQMPMPDFGLNWRSKLRSIPQLRCVVLRVWRRVRRKEKMCRTHELRFLLPALGSLRTKAAHCQGILGCMWPDKPKQVTSSKWTPQPHAPKEVDSVSFESPDIGWSVVSHQPYRHVMQVTKNPQSLRVRQSAWRFIARTDGRKVIRRVIRD